jgi:hypothetical protein
MNGMKSETVAGCDATRENNKAERLFYAIRNVNSLIEHLEHLKDRLGIPCSPMNENEAKAPQPTVAMLMSEGAGALDQIVSTAHESIGDIEKELLS